MKHYFILLSLLLGLVACQDSPDSLLPKDFHVTIDHIQAQRVYFEIYPQDEFTYYSLDFMPADSFIAHYGNDEEYIRVRDAELRTFGEDLLKSLLWCGTVRQSRTMLPNTHYVMLIFSYKGNEPIISLRKEYFTTLPRKVNDFHLDSVVLVGDMITLYPSPSSMQMSYYWDYATNQDVRLQFYGLHSYFFYSFIDNYYQLNFMPELLSRGEDGEQWTMFYKDRDFQAGDTMTVMAVGYDAITGETTNQYEAWEFIRPQEESEYMRVHAFRAALDSLESIFMPL